MKKTIYLLCLLSMHKLVNAEIINLSCKSMKTDYNFVLMVNTIAKTVEMNNVKMSNVTISNSIINFEMENVDKSKGNIWEHTINRGTGVLTLRLVPSDLEMTYFQCSKITANKF